MDYLKLKKGFDEMSERGQWAWLIDINGVWNVTLHLDNDSTSFTFDDEDKTDDCTLFVFKADVGNRWGLEYLFQSLGIKAESV